MIIILFIVAWGFITDWKFFKSKKESFNLEKGICFFDIDGTLIDAIDDVDDIVQKCLDNNFEVGIITASGRTPEMLCSGEKPLVPWSGSKLCKYLNDTNNITYNSATPILAGKYKLPNDFPSPHKNPQGTCKGYAMIHASKIRNIKPENIVLFDDQKPVVDDVKRFHPSLDAVLVDCNGRHCKDGRNASKLSVKVVDDWFKSRN